MLWGRLPDGYPGAISLLCNRWLTVAVSRGELTSEHSSQWGSPKGRGHLGPVEPRKTQGPRKMDSSEREWKESKTQGLPHNVN